MDRAVACCGLLYASSGAQSSGQGEAEEEKEEDGITLTQDPEKNKSN